MVSFVRVPLDIDLRIQLAEDALKERRSISDQAVVILQAALRRRSARGRRVPPGRVSMPAESAPEPATPA